MIAGKMKYVKTHQCASNQTKDIVIEQYTDGRVSHWYWNFEGKLHGIGFCPYCGKNLYEDIIESHSITQGDVEGHTKHLQGIDLPIMVNTIWDENNNFTPSEVSEMHIGTVNGKQVLLVTPEHIAMSGTKDEE